MLTDRRYAHRAVVVCVIGLACGCGSVAASGQASSAGGVSDNAPLEVPSTQSTGEGVTPTSIDFTSPPPIAGLVAVDAGSATSGELGFSPVRLQQDKKYQEYLSTATNTFAMTSATESGTPFWVEEIQAPQSLTSEFERLAACDANVSPGCNPEWQITTLSSGNEALTITGEPSTVVIFVSGNVRFDVLGPPDTFSLDDAIAVASSLDGK